MTDRIRQVNHLLLKELNSIVFKEIEFPPGALATITRVEATPNLQQAKVYISIMPDQKRKEILGLLRSHVFEIQQFLNKRLNMRPVPRIEWMFETKASEAQRIEELLEKIHDTK